MASPTRRRAEEARWHTASQVLAWLRRHPGATRAALVQDLGLASGLATEITGRLRALRLLVETPAPPQGRGRPTTVLGPHPQGPVVLAVDLRMEDWRSAVAGLDGRPAELTTARHAARDPATVLAVVRGGIDAVRARYGSRLRAVSIAVAGTIHDGRLAQSATLGWRDVDLTGLTGTTPLLPGNHAALGRENVGAAEPSALPVSDEAAAPGRGNVGEAEPSGEDAALGRDDVGAAEPSGEDAVLGRDDVGALPLLLGNDATLAGVAEARTGAAVGSVAALHLMVEVGIGGAFIVDGRPLSGAHGAAGEYGHLPYGDRGLACPCGARGCWDLDVDGRALARHLGESDPADPRSYARQILDRVPDDAGALRAVRSVAAALGAGIGGLVNLHDPDTVTLGGLAAPLRAAAPEAFAEAYAGGLMAFRRGRPPPVLDAVHGDDGALHGAALLALDEVTSEAALAAWAQSMFR